MPPKAKSGHQEIAVIEEWAHRPEFVAQDELRVPGHHMIDRLTIPLQAQKLG